jgi:hypothetical protein
VGEREQKKLLEEAARQSIDVVRGTQREDKQKEQQEKRPVVLLDRTEDEDEKRKQKKLQRREEEVGIFETDACVCLTGACRSANF